MGARTTYRVDVAYDGSRFAGFAQQPDALTVEGAVVAALNPLIPKLRSIDAGGRTDKGVHALGQVISFWANRRIPLDELEDALGRAAEGLFVLGAREVPRWFHARFSATERRYVYVHPDPSLDVARLDRMLFALTGTRDFHAFSRDTPKGKSTVRRLAWASARPCPAGVHIEIAANGFLRHQVRIVVSTALRELARGADEDVLVALAETRDRTRTEYPADPGGLTLAHVSYASRGPGS